MKLTVKVEINIDVEKYMLDNDCTKEEAIQQIKELVKSAGAHELEVNGYVTRNIQ